MYRPVAAPPEPFDPVAETVSSGTGFFRVYAPGQGGRPPESFNPGTSLAVRAARQGAVFPVSRFSFFLDGATPEASPVPTIYAAPTENVAIWETILRDREPADTEPVPYADFTGRVLSRITAARDLRMASPAGADMHRLNLPPDELTFPGAGQYAETIAWARAVWDKGFDGIRYMSRRDPSGLAYVFFERPEMSPMFEVSEATDCLQVFDDISDDGGFEWLSQRLARWGIGTSR